MLSGYPPFNGHTVSQIYDKIKKGKYSLCKHGWETVSKEAKMLIKKMLEFSPEKRISAEAALNDLWVQSRSKLPMSELTFISTSTTLKNLQTFQVQTKLHTTVISFIANYVQSQKIQARLRREFALLDTNGDGILQKEELIKGYTASGKTPKEATQIVEAIMEKIDVNNNGIIDFSEFLAASLNKEQALAEAPLREAFDLFDKDKNGQITVEELEEVLGAGQEDTEAILEILQNADTDGDGQISFPEFREMMFKFFSQ